jgi:phosphate:Na+ symporter
LAPTSVRPLPPNNKLPVSIEAKRDLRNYFALVDRQFEAVIHALKKKDAESVSLALDLEEEINSGYAIMSDHHVKRLNDGTCTVGTGVIFLDVIANLEKIADHLTNIAERVEVKQG